MDLLTELIEFCRDLKRYREALINPDSILTEDKKKGAPSGNLEELREELRETLVLEHGVLKDEIAKLIGRTDINQFNRTWNRALSRVFGIGENKDALSLCIDYTLEAIGRLDKEEERLLQESLEKPKDVLIKESKEMIEPPKAFIAHEGETRALTMLKEFLEALEIQFFIAESKASDGRSIEKQVDWTQSKADFAICLATKGKAINKKTGRHYMAPNIIDELGRARQVFGNKIILLVQKGVEVHTNIKEIVYETFTTTNMERAFIKIVKELKNWGFIRAVKP